MAKLTEAQRRVLLSVRHGGFITHNRVAGSVWGPSGRIHVGTFNALVLDRRIAKHGENDTDAHYAITTAGRLALDGGRSDG